MQLVKIISGGQTGADQAGLRAGKSLGLATGGWIPKGFRTDSGSHPELGQMYGLLEHISSAYPPRTEMNVRFSDATLIFGNANSPGCRLTASLCNQIGRSFMRVNWRSSMVVSQEHFEANCKEFARWLTVTRARVLNVAGNREKSQPGIEAECFKFITETVKLMQKEQGQQPEKHGMSDVAQDQALADITRFMRRAADAARQAGKGGSE